MNWKELLSGEIEATYATTQNLIRKVNPAELDWKPATGGNWMTTGQLLKHISTACGFGCRALITGDWGLPEGKSYQDLSPADMFPPAESMPTVRSVPEAEQLLAEDKRLALETIEQSSESDLADKVLPVPWDPATLLPLGCQILQLVEHLKSHKAQLFYYLKLQGQPVGTVDLWG